MKRLISSTGLILISLLLSIILGSLTAACGTGDATGTPAPVYQSNTSLPSLSGVAKRTLSSVVYVHSIGIDGSSQPVESSGSGVILGSDGYILTNRHVVENSNTITVTLFDRRQYSVSGDQIWTDDVVDLAVLKISETNLPVLQFGNSDNVNVGDWVLAVGHALGFSPIEGGATVSEGIVSNLGRTFNSGNITYYGMVQTTAAINPGNSGGPLVNLAGEIVGINSAATAGAQNVGFAINTGISEHIYLDLVKYGQPHHPFFGVNLHDVTPDTVYNRAAPRLGALIMHIDSASPAERARLKYGDIITKLDEAKISSAAELIQNVWLHEPGDLVKITYWRDGKESTVTVTLEQRPGNGDI